MGGSQKWHLLPPPGPPRSNEPHLTPGNDSTPSVSFDPRDIGSSTPRPWDQGGLEGEITEKCNGFINLLLDHPGGLMGSNPGDSMRHLVVFITPGSKVSFRFIGSKFAKNTFYIGENVKTRFLGFPVFPLFKLAL